MTEWRDARLKQALDHAPDAHMAPDARTRAAIQALAAQAIAPAAPLPVRLRFRRWLAPGPGRMPWNAAFATLLLAGLVTLAWHEEEIPGARTGDQAIATAPAETGTSAPRPAASSKGATPVAPEPAPPIAADVSRAAGAAAEARDRKAQAQAHSQAQAQVQAKKERQEESANARAKDGVAAVPAQPGGELPAPVAPASPPPVLSQSPAAASRAVEPAAAEKAAALPRFAPSPVAPRVAAGASVGLPDSWTRARISLDGRTVVVERSGADRFASQLRALVGARGSGGLVGPWVLQVELLRGDEPAGAVLVGTAGVRWVPAPANPGEPGAAVLEGPVPAALVEELLGEARRIFAR